MTIHAVRPRWFEAQPKSIDGIEPPNSPADEDRVRVAILSVSGFVDAVCPPLEPAHFYSESNRRIVEACLAVRATDGAVDVIRVVEHLRDMGRLAQVGGTKALATPVKLSEVEQREAKSSAHVVWNCFHRREIALHCQQSLAALYHGGVATRELVEDIERRTYEICRTAIRANEANHIGVGLAEVTASVVGGVNPVCIPSGLETFDVLVDFMRTNEMSIVAADSGVGKSSFGIGAMVGAAKRGFGGLYISTEMKHIEISQRMLAAESGVPASRIRMPKRLDDRDRIRVLAAADRLRNLPIHVDAEPFGQTIGSIRAQARRVASMLERRGGPLKLVVVDYFQDLEFPALDRNSQEWQRLKKGASDLKDLAVELDVHIMALSQITVPPNPPKGWEPDKGNLAGGRVMIARPASIVMFITSNDDDEAPRRVAKLLIRKGRNISKGRRTVIFDGPACRFEDGDPDYTEVR